jgi:hypothetical protein
MAGVSTCVNHPTKTATHKCKRCSKPICQQCLHKTELGIFCSQECHDAVKEFQSKLIDARPAKKSGIDFGKAFKRLIILGALVGGLYGYFFMRYGDRTPQQIWARVQLWMP